jgi:hypothetical protein
MCLSLRAALLIELLVPSGFKPSSESRRVFEAILSQSISRDTLIKSDYFSLAKRRVFFSLGERYRPFVFSLILTILSQSVPGKNVMKGVSLALSLSITALT